MMKLQFSVYGLLLSPSFSTLMLPLPAKPGVNVAAAQFAASAIFWSVAPLQVVLRIP